MDVIEEMKKERDIDCLYLQKIYDILCEIEYNIINKKIDIGVIEEVIKNQITLIEDCYMPTCIFIKLM